MATVLPPLSLLDDVTPEPDCVNHKARIAQIHRALEAFELDARVVRHSSGPACTTYELELAPGTRVAKVIGLAPDLSIHLGVPSVRVFYPLPEKTTVGLEVPNPKATPVRLRRVMEQVAERADTLGLPLFLGEGAEGEPIVADLAALPHLLVAGTTGSGKSACLVTAIASMLMARTADDLKLILIDPKQVELSAFKQIPHLLAPAVTDMRRTPRVMDWLVRQMEQRYSLFAKVGVKRIGEFNKLGGRAVLKKLKSEGEEPPDVPTHLPYIVVIIDELADLMMTAAKEVEGAIQRLSQKSRAVGIHMILATQRPSVDVLTGLIKSNMPSRVAFKVAANVDSRTIVDQPGAEKLLGKGDMLLMLNGSQQLARGQGTWIADAELKRVLGWLREHGGAATHHAGLCLAAGTDAVDPCDDELFDRAAEVVITEQRGSVSLVQRNLEIGFSRAGKLMDALEQAGIVGPQIGATARQVYVTLAEWRSRQVGAAPAAIPGPAPSRAPSPDPLFLAATLLVLAERRGGVERLRDLLGVSWERAASLMQALETAGVVERRPGTGEWRVRMSLREWRKKRGA
ncbi:MAG: DNA segregation ATPase FtsK/SpoIIIE S-DNA-T [Planctomycetota bacterium]|nr:MAG: DNA segregation ATPase FtsK/SpoIIIE S-DNA-T [Planctomycetota bacterium]